MKPSRELRDLMLGFLADVAEGSDAYVELLSASEHASMIGTDPEEFWVGGREIRALARVQQQEMGPTILKVDKVYAFEEGTVGWAFTRGTFGPEDNPGPMVRLTYLFHREDDGWKVVHLHASVGADTRDTFGRDVTTSIDAVADAVEQDRPDLAPVASPEGTVTIMFTDVEASTATNEALGDDRFLPLLLKHNDIVRSHTISAGGSVVKSQGDGFMLAFPAARRAVECAISVQREVVELSGPIRVRMGLHTGEPIRHSDDFFGRDVAYAARLGSAAIGGEILVSSLVKSLVEPSGSVKFEGPREVELKGFDGPQPIFAVVWR